jgi:DNA-binding transcriptional MocR family regulator
VPVRYQVSGGSASEISASVESGVRSGALAAGTALPPVRGLAADLGVSPATVAAAYQALRRRGIVETAGRNGTRVRPRPAVAGARGALRVPVPAGVLDLSSGEPDARLLPDLAVALASVAAEPAEAPGYDTAGPLPALVAAALERFVGDGLDLSGATIAVTGGALDAMERLLAGNLRPGDRVAIEDPGWANLLDLVAALGLVAVPMAVDDAGPTPDGLRRALTTGALAVIVTSRAHNPTGAAVTAERAAALRAVLRARPGPLLIEDDHAAQLAAQPLHSLAAAASSWAFVRSTSKPYGPDLRVALVAGDEATIGRLTGRQRLGTGWVSTLLQRTVVALWSSAPVGAAVEAAGRSYDRRRAALCAALHQRGIEAHGRTGINVWVPVADETSAVARLRDAGYSVAPGALYRIGTPPGIRITISRLDAERIDEFADAVAAALDRRSHGISY